MEVSTQIELDHPIDLKRAVTNPDGSATHEHLLTFIPVQFRGGTVKFCFVGRSDVNILREGARNCNPPASNMRPAGRFSNLAMTLKTGDLIRVGTGLLDLKKRDDNDLNKILIRVGTGLLDLRLMSVSRSRATIRATILADGLLLNLEPLGDCQELNLRGIIERLNRGADYRSDAH